MLYESDHVKETVVGRKRAADSCPWVGKLRTAPVRGTTGSGGISPGRR
jgi:hypothetical protein